MRVSTVKGDPFYCEATTSAIAMVYVDAIPRKTVITMNTDEGYIICIRRNPVRARMFDAPCEVDYEERIEGVVRYQLAPGWTHEKLLQFGASGADYSIARGELRIIGGIVDEL